MRMDDFVHVEYLAWMGCDQREVALAADSDVLAKGSIAFPVLGKPFRTADDIAEIRVVKQVLVDAFSRENADDTFGCRVAQFAHERIENLLPLVELARAAWYEMNDDTGQQGKSTAGSTDDEGFVGLHDG